jgi:hypothetical protein
MKIENILLVLNNIKKWKYNKTDINHYKILFSI